MINVNGSAVGIRRWAFLNVFYRFFFTLTAFKYAGRRIVNISKMSAPRQSCLIVLSAAKEGILTLFIHTKMH